MPSHGENTGSSPVGVTNKINRIATIFAGLAFVGNPLEPLVAIVVVSRAASDFMVIEPSGIEGGTVSRRF